MTRRVARLPIRLWLGFALLVIVVVPLAAAWGAYATLASARQQQQMAAKANLRIAHQFLQDNVTRWNDPRWQAGARAKLAALGVDARLVSTDGGTMLSIPAPLRGVSALSGGSDPTLSERLALAKRQRLGGQWWDSVQSAVSYPDGVKGPLGFAFLYASLPDQAWANPLVGGLLALLATLLLTLFGVAWFLGQTVVRPLAAMSRAARGIGAGQLDARWPTSRIREVAEASAALETMSAGLRQAMQRQVELEHERRLFIGAIAHDLRTPLFTLRAYLGGLERGLATTPEKAARYVTVCRDKADALERLIADLFAFAQVEYLEQAPRRERLELGALLRRVVEGAQPLAADKGVTLALDGPHDPGLLIGDGHLLARAIENLLDNALRHTPIEGAVQVRWSREDADLVFTVADSGAGIAAHDLPHLFTPLYRGETSRNRQTGGAGLGLATARRILQAHGGDLRAANRPTGGAVFTGNVPCEPGARPRDNGAPIACS